MPQQQLHCIRGTTHTYAYDHAYPPKLRPLINHQPFIPKIAKALHPFVGFKSHPKELHFAAAGS